MIYVSFVELFTSSVQTLVEMHGKSEGTFYATLSFFGGIVLILLIDKLIPRYENPHEMHRVEKPRDFDPFGHAGLSPLVTI